MSRRPPTRSIDQYEEETVSISDHQDAEVITSPHANDDDQDEDDEYDYDGQGEYEENYNPRPTRRRGVTSTSNRTGSDINPPPPPTTTTTTTSIHDPQSHQETKFKIRLKLNGPTSTTSNINQPIIEEPTTRRSNRNVSSSTIESNHKGNGMVTTRRTSDEHTTRGSRTRTSIGNNHGEEDVNEVLEEVQEEEREEEHEEVTYTRHGRAIKKPTYRDPDDSDDDLAPRRTTSRAAGKRNSFVEHDEEDDPDDEHGSRKTRSRGKKVVVSGPSSAEQRAQRANRRATKGSTMKSSDEEYRGGEDHSDDDDASGDPEEEDVLANHSPSASPPRRRAPRGARNAAIHSDEESEVPFRTLRARNRINYALPPPIEDLPKKSRFGVLGGGRGGGTPGGGPSRLDGFMADINLGMGMVGDPTAGYGHLPDSDSDDEAPERGRNTRNEGGSAGMSLAGGAGNAATSGPVVAGQNAMGKFDARTKAALADADPLGVNLDINFDQVGGLDDHINQLKEMVALPLLYPELYQQFGIIPPRGVLFHGPPGTGKTLLARALASSCSNSTTKISFFMRKGADVLSKWVGEAERQLRVLFEEAKNAQPSIIFFDEIDGLAPVRSAKQDQIHASLVSTLLALMDGMDGRGQVIVIGATNRPDSVDPALRRPGRFDREFHFPLPNKDARKKILSINTRKWQPQLEDQFLDELAAQTKGYGGADLRALCTEAALNAIQRRYPQIYKTEDRLLLDPSSIGIQAKDFMMSIRKIIPSSARSAASSAIPIPAHLQPLLSDTFEQIKAVVHDVLPVNKRRTVLEEAEWEDEDDGTFEREMLLQSFETMQLYRPRVMIHGERGMGQRVLGSAVLHHLEGYHVQNLDLASLLGQSTGTVETAIVQMFVEAKRHQPSVLYIPSLIEWSNTLAETSRATVGALLDSLGASEPVLLLALVDGDLADVPYDVRSWFGYTGNNAIFLDKPTLANREAFFETLLGHIRLPPAAFPDGMPRRKRILEKLAIAPPLVPKPPSEAQIAAQLAKDTTTKEILVHKLGPILDQLKKKHRKNVLPVTDAFVIYTLRVNAAAQLKEQKAQHAAEQAAVKQAALDEASRNAPDPLDALSEQGNGEDINMEGLAGKAVPNGVHEATVRLASPFDTSIVNDATMTDAASPAEPVIKKPHYVDFDLIQNKLIESNNGYLSLQSFQRDIERMAENVTMLQDDLDRRAKAHAMVIEAKLLIKDYFQDEQQKLDIEAMAERERVRRRGNKSKGASPTNSAKGTRQSARVSGTQPEYNHRALAELEAANRKRQRERSGSGTSPMEEGGAAKRPRIEIDGGVNGPVYDPAVVVTGDGIHVDAAVNGPSTDTAIAAPIVSLLGHISAGSTAEDVQLVSEATPPPTPPFILPEAEFHSLTKLVSESTLDFNIEELEQLRALLMQRIWKRRKDWDRSDLIQEMTRVARDFIQQVTRSKSVMNHE